jgi:soluble lytic murein transglycosylase
LRLALAQFESRRERHGVGLFAARAVAPDYMRYGFDEMPEVFWRALYPRAYWGLIRREARANGLDPYLVMALVRQESAFDPRATSRADARGLMQILPRTAAGGRRRSQVARRLYDPAYNVRFGCRYFSRRLRELDGRPEFALAAYNAGASRVKRWIAERTFSDPAEFFESLPFAETRLYVENVLCDAEIYRRLLTGQVKFADCVGEVGKEE